MPKPKPNPSTPTPAEPAAPAVPPKATADDRPPLPPGWVWTTLGEIVTPSPERADPNSLAPDTPYIGLEHIEKGTGKLIGHGWATEVRSAKNVFRAGDVLYGKLRPYLNKVCIPDFDGVCSTDILVFSKQEYLDNRFLKYRLLASDFVHYANLHISGVQHPRVHFKQLAKFPVALPPLSEQRRIVAKIEELFSQLDAAEEGLRRVQRNLKRYRAAVLKAAVEGRLVPRGRGDPADRPHETGAELLQRILAERRRKWEEQEWAKLVEKAKKKAAQARRKAQGRPARLKDIPPEEWQAIPEEEYRRYLPKDDRWKQRYKEPAPPDTANLPPLPEGWVWASLPMLVGDKGIFRDGDWIESKDQDPNGEVRLIQLADIGDGEFRDRSARYLTLEKAHELKCTFLEPGDILIARMPEPLGRACIFPNLPQIAVTAVDVCILRVDQRFVDRHWIMYAINAPRTRSWIASYQSGSTRGRVSRKNLAKVPVPLPPLAEQRRIVAEVERRLSVAREAEKAVEANLKRIARLRQTILKRAFEGRL